MAKTSSAANEMFLLDLFSNKQQYQSDFQTTKRLLQDLPTADRTVGDRESDIFFGEIKNPDQPRTPPQNEVQPAKNNNNKQYFEEEGFLDLLGGDSSVNNSNIKIKDACLLKMDGC